MTNKVDRLDWFPNFARDDTRAQRETPGSVQEYAVFVYDQHTQQITRIPSATSAISTMPESIVPSISADGQLVAFASLLDEASPSSTG